MKILYGMQQPDEGTDLVDGREVRSGPHRRHRGAGIGMVHQHFMLADNLTVLENMVLGDPSPRRGPDRLRGRQGPHPRAGRHAYGLEVDPDALVEELTVGDRQRVEILKVLYRGARILILDEPTAVLVPQEVDELFANLRELKREGVTIMFISHKLDEVLASPTHHRDPGRHHRRHGAPAEVTPASWPSSWSAASCPRPRPASPRSPTGSSSRSRPHRRRRRRAGRAERHLLPHPRRRGGRDRRGGGQRPDPSWSRRSWACGPRRPARSVLGGEDDHDLATLKRREAGVGYIPEDRHRQGLLLPAPLWENVMLGHQSQAPVRHRACGSIAGRRKRAPRR
jgi:general nucleoside transport system ATP-binding protein